MRRQRTAIATDLMRRARAGFERYYGGSPRNATSTLSRWSISSRRDALARSTASPTVRSRCISRGLDDGTGALLERVGTVADVYKRYQQMRVDRCARDRAATLRPGISRPLGRQRRPAVHDHRRHGRSARLWPRRPGVRASPAPPSDPANGRMDIVPGSNRKWAGSRAAFLV